VGAILRLSRLKFLAGGAVANSLGATLAYYETGVFDLSLFIIGQLVVTSTNLMVQNQNEYWDIESDRLSTQRIFSGGTGVLAKGLLSRKTALLLSLASISFAALLMIFLCYTLSNRGYLALIFLLAAFLSWAYSSPPLRLLSTGLGELNVGIILAVITPLFQYYLQTGSVSTILILCLPMFFFAFSIPLSFSYPDFMVDKQAGKQTLLVRLGWKRIGRLHVVLLALGYASLAAVRFTSAPASAIYLPFLTTPLALAMASILLNPEPTVEQLVRNTVYAALLPLLIAVLQMASLLIGRS